MKVTIRISDKKLTSSDSLVSRKILHEYTFNCENSELHKNNLVLYFNHSKDLGNIIKELDPFVISKITQEPRALAINIDDIDYLMCC